MAKENLAPGETVCSCGHGRRQHSKEGCTWSEFKNGRWIECKCKKKYMAL